MYDDVRSDSRYGRSDFLVNLYEDDVNRHGIEQAYQQIFRTQTGKEIFNQMYTDER